MAALDDAIRRIPNVRLATPADAEEMCSTLVGAFIDDPVSVWIYPDASTRGGFLHEWYTMSVAAGLRSGRTYTAADNAAVAIWSPPSVPQLFGHGREGIEMADMFERQLGDRTRHVTDGLLGIERAHPRHTAHYYLAMLGTAPALQGRGLGGALLDEVLAICDTDGFPAYLETSKDRNVGFYSSRGFEVTGTMELSEGPQVWFMWRDPVTGGTPPRPQET